MRYVNVGFQVETFKKIEGLVERRKISRFVNEAVEEKLQKQQQKDLIEKQKARKELREKMLAGYQENLNNQKLQKELQVWDRISGEGLDDE